MDSSVEKVRMTHSKGRYIVENKKHFGESFMVRSKSFVLGRANPDAYGNLELYCQHYKTPYALFICSLVGAGLIMIGKI